MIYALKIIRELKQRRFWETLINRKWGLFILKHVDATKFVFLIVFTIIETICPNIRAKPLSKNEKKTTSGLPASLKKRLCLSSLLSIQRKHVSGKTVTCLPGLPWAGQLFLHFLTKLGKPFTWEQKVALARRMTRLSEYGCWKNEKLKPIITCGHAFPPMWCALQIFAPSFNWFVRLHECACPK